MRQAARLGIAEDFPQVRARIGGYWSVTPQVASKFKRQNAIWQAGGADAGWSDAWSAAFVSWVMCEAGFTERQFLRSHGHYEYVDAAIADEDASFRARDIADTLPQTGDVVCSDRRRKPSYRTVADRRRQLGQQAAMHCDIVVGVGATTVFMIGGNVVNSVSLTAIPLRGQGDNRRIDMTRVGMPAYFAILAFEP